MAQLLAALQGGWVAGETDRHSFTFAAAGFAPICAAQARGPVEARSGRAGAASLTDMALLVSAPGVATRAGAG
jgi:hypothetical protein